MTVIRLANGRVILHSPCKITPEIAQEIREIGDVAFIVAPGNFHHLNVPSAQAAFPAAKTYICPGIEDKRPDLRYDAILGDDAVREWAGELDQVLVRGSRWIWEVAFYHKASNTLILVDLIENITDDTPRINLMLKFWWKIVFRMWNKALPAPEYRIGWKNKVAARASLNQILEWDFKRIILAHGDLVENNAHEVALTAWHGVLKK